MLYFILGDIFIECFNGQLIASSFALFMHVVLLGLLPSPQTQHVFNGSVAGGDELAPEVQLSHKCASVTTLELS